MTETRTLTLAEIEDLSFRALVAAGTSEENARPLAVATAATEADGVASHGLAYIPVYCEHVQCGKVDGQAKPVLSRPKPGVIRVDAATSFAHSAIDFGFEALIFAGQEQGVAALSVYNSYNCGVLGYHTYRLAQAGLVGLGFTNAPASIAPSGGYKGGGVALLTEIMAAALTGATLGINASPFSGTVGGPPPKTGSFSSQSTRMRHQMSVLDQT